VSVWCGLVWFGVVWCGVVWCGVVWCGVVWCGVVWCGGVWCGVVWCGVVWCGVVWCGAKVQCKVRVQFDSRLPHPCPCPACGVAQGIHNAAHHTASAAASVSGEGGTHYIPGDSAGVFVFLNEAGAPEEYTQRKGLGRYPWGDAPAQHPRSLRRQWQRASEVGADPGSGVANPSTPASSTHAGRPLDGVAPLHASDSVPPSTQTTLSPSPSSSSSPHRAAPPMMSRSTAQLSRRSLQPDTELHARAARAETGLPTRPVPVQRGASSQSRLGLAQDGAMGEASLGMVGSRRKLEGGHANSAALSLEGSQTGQRGRTPPPYGRTVPIHRDQPPAEARQRNYQPAPAHGEHYHHAGHHAVSQQQQQQQPHGASKREVHPQPRTASGLPPPVRGRKRRGPHEVVDSPLPWTPHDDRTGFTE